MPFTVHIAAALALHDQPGIDAEEIVRKSMKIAGDICVYTNHNITLEKLDQKPVSTTTAVTTMSGTTTPPVDEAPALGGSGQ